MYLSIGWLFIIAAGVLWFISLCMRGAYSQGYEARDEEQDDYYSHRHNSWDWEE